MHAAQGSFSLRRDTIQWLIPVLLALGAAAVLGYWWAVSEPPREAPVEEHEPAQGSPPAEEPPAEPRYPLTAGEGPRPGNGNADLALPPLPPLGESDRYVRDELSALFGAGLADALVAEDVVARLAATVDNLAREQVAERIRPVAAPGGQFLVENVSGTDEYLLDPQNHGRYDDLVGFVEHVDPARAAQVYRRLHPLFQQAYADLGYPDGWFNDRLVEVIDHLLRTPDVEEPIRLVRPHVLYEFADPRLEALSPGQKLLLRIGGEHRALVKQRLREFRAGIAGDAAP